MKIGMVRFDDIQDVYFSNRINVIQLFKEYLLCSESDLGCIERIANSNSLKFKAKIWSE